MFRNARRGAPRTKASGCFELASSLPSRASKLSFLPAAAMDATPSALLHGRMPGLDGLRALAVTGVIALHSGFRWLPGGGIGVFVFFTLSGFLITHLLLTECEQTGRISIRRFYARRALRLLPALYILILATVLWGLGHPSILSDRTLEAVPSVVLYFSNWIRALVDRDAVGRLGHTWSLSVEEQFYILWPLVIVSCMASQRSAKRVMQIAIAGSILSATLRIVFWTGVTGAVRTEGTDQIADQILVGCALAAWLHTVDSTRLDRMRAIARGFGLLGAVILLGVALAVPTDDVAHAKCFSLVLLPFVAFASAALIASIVLAPRDVLARLLSIWPISWIGQISYGMYLWHILAIENVRKYWTWPTSVFLASVVLSIALAVFSWFIIERPALRLKQRFAVVH